MLSEETLTELKRCLANIDETIYAEERLVKEMQEWVDRKKNYIHTLVSRGDAIRADLAKA